MIGGGVPYYDAPLDGDAVPQATFTAVQTAVLDSVASSSAAAASSSSAAAASSASSASAAASSAAAASSSLASASSAATASRTAGASPTSGTGSVQHATAGAPFPRWAIAVIVVLGFAAMFGGVLLVLAFQLHSRKEERERKAPAGAKKA